MTLDVRSLLLPEVKLIRASRFPDQRGYFTETYARRNFHSVGITGEFVQDNQSLSFASGTIRGLHFQAPPFAQAKLVRVLRGRILDVAVDLRRSSPHYGMHVAVELNAEDGSQLFIPAGFAHGFCTLVNNTEVMYKVDSYYSASHDRGINWADPALGIRWPIKESEATISDKDRALPILRALGTYFE
jgi:dTDP-4-dehydrorhamnose 3,5-epimerase